MAIRLLGPLNRVINLTASEILESQVIDKATNVVSTFITSGVEAIKELTEEGSEDIAMPEAPEESETPQAPNAT